MSDPNDKELYESAIQPEVTEQPETAKTEPEGPPRDEHGRFTKAEETAEPAAAETAEPAVSPVETKKPDEAHVPSWRLREVNEAREAAERRARELEERQAAFERRYAELQAKLQPQPEPVDPWQDLPGYLRQSEVTLEQRVAAAEKRATLRASRAEQIAIHGRQVVDEMEKAIGEAMRAGHPELGMLSVQMQNSDDPVGVAMQWYQRDKLVRETGGDVTVYRNKLSDELLKDPAFLAKALEAARALASGHVPGQPNTTVQLPPSINRQAAAASPHDDPSDLSDRSLYSFATR